MLTGDLRDAAKERGYVATAGAGFETTQQRPII